MLIRILPANPNWPGQFAGLKTALRPALPRGALIHHIGSTAVPGLVAKDIIDIQITLDDLADLNHGGAADRRFRPPQPDH